MRASADSIIDDQLSVDAINKSLAGLEAGAFKSGGIKAGQVAAVVYWGSGPDAAGVQVCSRFF